MHKNLFLAVSMTIAVVAASVASSAAQAAAYGDTSPLYAGIGAGRSNYDVMCFGPGNCGVHSKSSGKVYAGFNFAPMTAWPGSELNGALELTAYLGGHAKVVSPLLDYRATHSYKGAGLGYRLSLRETESLSLNARLGLAYLRGKIETSGGTYGSENRTALSSGLGLSYALDRHWSLQADYDLLHAKFARNEKSRIHLFTLGAAYKF